MRFPVIGDISTKDGDGNQNARLTNTLAESKKNGTTLATVRPGLNGLATSSGNGNSLVCFGGELINIYGNTVYRMDAEGGDVLNDPNSGTMSRVFFENGKANWDSLVITKGEARYTGSYTPACPLGVSDPLWEDVVLYLDFEGADGSTTITDAKGHTITNPFNAEIDTAQFSCGASSLLIDTGMGNLQTPYSADFNLGTGDFCIEVKCRFHNLSLIDYGADINMVGFYRNNSPYGGYRFVLATDEGTEEIIGMGLVEHGIQQVAYEAFSPLVANTWYTFAVSRSGGIVRLFKDGEMIDEIDTSVYTQTNIGTVTDNYFDFALIP